jgi:hypothetical protein
MTYLSIDEKMIALKSFYPDMVKLFLEIDQNGRICREIGMNHSSGVIHRYPDSSFEYGEYGIMDTALFKSDTVGNLDRAEFESYWNHTEG